MEDSSDLSSDAVRRVGSSPTLGTNVGARIYKFIEIKGGNSAAPPTLFKLSVINKICCKMKKHDENKDVKLVGKFAKVDTRNKTITMSRNTSVGIRSLGRLDFLVNHCGYIRLFDNGVVVAKGKNVDKDDDTTKRKPKKSKEHQLTDKTKRNTKKK